jgi:hypothetical protein
MSGNRTLSPELLRQLKPYVLGWVTDRISGGSTPSGEASHNPVTLSSYLDDALSVDDYQVLDWLTQSANTILAGPASGVAARPTFRALTAADLPSGIGANSHTRLHDILGTADHSVTGSANQIVGLTSINTLGLLTPSVTAGAGLTGGGNPVAGITLAVGAGDGVTVNADDVTVKAYNGINVDVNGVSVNQAYTGFNWQAKHTFSEGLKLANDTNLEIGDDVLLTRLAANTLTLGTGDALQSPNFMGGVSGWRIEADGSAEFQNAWIRGELHTSVFVANEMHASGGTIAVLNASTIAEPINATDNILVSVGSTMSLVVQASPGTGLCPFAKGDVIRVKGYLTK